MSNGIKTIIYPVTDLVSRERGSLPGSAIQVDAPQGGGEGRYLVVSASTTTQRGASWAAEAGKTTSLTGH